MKKIKSIKQLQAEKKKIKQQQAHLEKKIQSNWIELKECLKPANMATDILNKTIKNNTEENLNSGSIIKSTLTYGFTLLAQKFADIAEKKFDRFFNK